MRRFGCVPGLVILAMAAAVVAMAGALLSTSAMAMAGVASMMMTQCIMGVAIIGLLAGGAATLALRNPFIRLTVKTTLQRKFNLPEPSTESLPAEARPASLPASTQQPIVIQQSTRRVRVKADTFKKWGF